MNERHSFSWRFHLPLLVILCAVFIVLWMLPAVLTGFPLNVPMYVLSALEFAETGMLDPDHARLTPLILAALFPVVGIQNIMGWMLVSAVAFALGIAAWWCASARLFGVRIAWVSAVIISLLPLYWMEVAQMRSYEFALFFLFLGFALFVWLYDHSRVLAVIVFAICFGAALACKDAFLTFLPWMVGAYMWHGRRQLTRSIAKACVFLAVAYAAFAAPLTVNVLQSDEPFLDRLAIYLPSLAEGTPGTGHLYPDDYTYQFNKDAYDDILRERAEDPSFLVRQENAHYREIFGVTDWSIGTSFWLLLNALPPLFLMDTVGGMFLWLFIIPGIVTLYRERRTLLFHMLGVWISMEFLLRFVLHFGRDHTMDIGWIIALLVAVGMVSIADVLAQHWKKSAALILSILLLATSVQLVQANRKQLARLYARSPVPEMYAATDALQSLPDDAVVIYHSRKHKLFFFSPAVHREELNNETVIRLSEDGRLREPFDHYSVTHAIGFNKEATRIIEDTFPQVDVLRYSADDFSVPLTPLIRFILNVVR